MLLTQLQVLTTETTTNKDGSTETTTNSQESSTEGTTIAPVEGAQVHNFTLNGTSSSFYTITGTLTSSYGSVNYNGLTLTKALKMDLRQLLTSTQMVLLVH